MQAEYSTLSQRYCLFKPVAAVIDREWFVRDGEREREEFAGLREEFEMPGREGGGRFEKIGRRWRTGGGLRR